jgi:hypothetical protein
MILSEVAVASWGVNRLDVFGVGTNNGMFHRAYNGDWAKTHWEPMGSETFKSAPAAVSWGPNRLDVFALGTNNEILHQAWNGTAWVGWEALLDTFNSAPAAVSWGPNRLDIFARGSGADRQMYHEAFDGDTLRPWAPRGAPPGDALSSALAVVSWAPNRLDIFALDTTNQMQHQAWDGSAWRDWAARGGGAFNSPPAVVSRGANSLDVFAVAPTTGCFTKGLVATPGFPATPLGTLVAARSTVPLRSFPGAPIGWTSSPSTPPPTRYSTKPGTAAIGRPGLPLAVSSLARRPRSPGARIGWTSSPSAPMAKCTIRLGTATPGNRPRPAGNLLAAFLRVSQNWYNLAR